MDALGGGDESFAGKAANWDVTEKHGKVSKTETDLDDELKDFKGEFVDKEKGANAAEKFFSGWDEAGRDPACEKRAVARAGR
jgi:hypothetical protein